MDGTAKRKLINKMADMGTLAFVGTVFLRGKDKWKLKRN
jgi:hypothetical protein